MIDLSLLVLAISGFSAFIFLVLTLKLTRREYISKKLDCPRDMLVHFLDTSNRISDLISSGKVEEAEATFSTLVRKVRTHMFKSRVIFFLMYSMSNIYTIFGAKTNPLLNIKAETQKEISIGLKSLRENILNLKEECFLEDLCRIIFAIIADKPFTIDVSTRKAFNAEINDLAKIFTNFDWLDRKTLVVASQALWYFFDKWARREEDTISFCTAVLLNLDFFPLETWYYMCRSTFEPWGERLRIIGNRIDDLSKGLQNDDHLIILRELSGIHIDSFRIDREFIKASSKEVAYVREVERKKLLAKKDQVTLIGGKRAT